MSKQTNKKRNNNRYRTTILTDVMSFPTEEKALKEEIRKRIIIDDPVHGVVPNSNPEIKFVKQFIGIKNPDGTEGELVIDLDRCFSFGVCEQRAPDTGVLNGYSEAISMYDRDGATEKQLRTVAFINAFCDVLKEILLTDEMKETTEKYELEAADLKKLNPLFLKKEKGKVVEGSTPTFYPKLIWFKSGKDKNGKERPSKMMTKYYSEDEINENGEQLEVDPLDLIGVKHYITPAIKFESTYLSAKTNNLQIKIYEAETKVTETGPKRMLKVGRSSGPSISIGGVNPLLNRSSNLENSVQQDDDSLDEKKEQVKPTVTVSKPQLVASDDEAPEDEESKPKKKVVIRKKVPKAQDK